MSRHATTAPALAAVLLAVAASLADSPESRCESVRLAGDTLWVGTTGGLVWYDVTDPARPTSIDRFFLREGVRDVAVRGRYAMLAVGSRGLYALDLEHPDGMQVVARHEMPGSARSLDWDGDTVYVGAGTHGLEVVSTRYPDRPRRVAHLPARGKLRAFSRDGDRLVLLDDGFGLRLFDVSDPASPRERSGRRLEGTAWDVALRDGVAWVAADDDGLRVFRVDDDAIEERAPVATRIRAFRVTGDGRRLVVADGRASFEHFRLADGTAGPLGTVRVHRAARTQDLSLRGDLVAVAGGTRCFGLFGLTDPDDVERFTDSDREMRILFP